MGTKRIPNTDEILAGSRGRMLMAEAKMNKAMADFDIAQQVFYALKLEHEALEQALSGEQPKAPRTKRSDSGRPRGLPKTTVSTLTTQTQGTASNGGDNADPS